MSKLISSNRATVQSVLLVGALVAGVNLVVVAGFAIVRSISPKTGNGLTELAATGGFVSRTFVDREGLERRYVLFVPYEQSDRVKPPLLLFLNGYGENGSDGLKQISKNFGAPVWELRRQFPFVVVAPQCHEGKTWMPGGGEIEAALDLIDDISREFHTDSDRHYLTGVSNGGSAAWAIASTFPSRFAAVVPLCASGGADVSTIAAPIATANLPIWSFFNGLDNDDVVKFNRAMKQELLKAGASPIVTEYPQGGHNCWDAAFRTPALYTWLLDQNRSKNQRAARFHVLGEGGGLERDFHVSKSARTLNQSPPAISIAGDPNTDEWIFTRTTFEDAEFHLEIRTDGKNAVDLVLRSQAKSDTDSQRAASDGCKLTLCPADQGSGGLVSLNGATWIAALNPVAQRSWKSGEWNDVRLAMTANRCIAWINGACALDVSDDRLRGQGSFGVVHARSRPGDTEVRNLRFRALSSSMGQDAK